MNKIFIFVITATVFFVLGASTVQASREQSRLERECQLAAEDAEYCASCGHSDWVDGECMESVTINGSDSTGTDTSTHQSEYEDASSGSSSSHGGGDSSSSDSTEDGESSDELNAYAEEKMELLDECNALLDEMDLTCGSKTCLKFASCAADDDAADCFAEVICSSSCSEYTDTSLSTDKTEEDEVLDFEEKPAWASDKSDPYTPIKWSDSYYGVDTPMKEIEKNKGTELPKGEWEVKVPIPVSEIIKSITKNNSNQSGANLDSNTNSAARNAIERWDASIIQGKIYQQCTEEMAEYYIESSASAVAE